jgi:hypothetical protein
MKDAGKRAAAFTMLGKTIELSAILIQNASPDDLPVSVATELRDLVASIHDEAYKYDIAYIQEAMQWTLPGAGSVSNGNGVGGGNAFKGELAPLATSSLGPGNAIFGIAVDAPHGQVVTGGKDTYLQVWSQDGEAIQKLDLNNQYVNLSVSLWVFWAKTSGP